MSVEQYDEICGRFEAKHQCMLKNNVKILRKAEYSKYISYVRQKYGAGYLKSFRV